MDVSIIIVNYNTKEITLKCIETIFRQTNDIEYEVIVVDNNSADGSSEAIRKNYPQIILLETFTNLGFGKANNLGAKYARGKFLFLLNSDTLLLNNVVRIFYNFHNGHPELKIGAIGCPMINYSHENIHSSGLFPSKKETIKSTFLGYFSNYHWNKVQKKELSKYDNLKTYLEVDYVTGADMFISKALFEVIGGFDPNFFMYFEESELQFRLRNMGYKSYIINGPEIIHIIEASDDSPGFSMKKRRIQTNSFLYYYKKHSNTLDYVLFRVLYFLVRLPLIFDKRSTMKERLEFLLFLLKR
jgi:GT2 family glycosyltransferase